MNTLGWVAAGLAAGLAGAAAWLAIAYYGHIQIGYLAWGIGFMVGVAVRYVAYLGDVDESPILGLYSAAVAMGSILLAKYGLYQMLVVNAGLAGQIPFGKFFSLFDFLWFGLACVTAFRIGAGSYGADDD